MRDVWLRSTGLGQTLEDLDAGCSVMLPVPDGDIDRPFVHSPLLSVCLFSWFCVW